MGGGGWTGHASPQEMDRALLRCLGYVSVALLCWLVWESTSPGVPSRNGSSLDKNRSRQVSEMCDH